MMSLGLRYAPLWRVAILASLLGPGCGSSSSSSSPAVFATEGTGTWKTSPATPPLSLDNIYDPQLFWTGSVVLIPAFSSSAVPVFTGLLVFDPVGRTWKREATSGGSAYGYQSSTSVTWTGKVLLEFGGRPIAQSIDPSTGKATNWSLTGALSFRGGAIAVWTGSRMIIWEGYTVDPSGNTVVLTDGAMYEPATDSWFPMSLAPGPKAGYGPDLTAIWTGTHMLVWGGFQGTTGIPAGLAYDPEDNTWAPLPSEGQPSARAGHAAVWTGTEMIVWGGAPLGGPGGIDTLHPFADGGAYNPTTQTWRSIVAPNTGLFGPAGVWTGTEMLVWGGYDEYACGGAPDCTGSNLGYRYNPTTDQWKYITTVNAPSPRVTAGATWTGNSLFILGGDEAGVTVTDGAEWFP
jgi:N-acetylneuraminic acid mutarotase